METIVILAVLFLVALWLVRWSSSTKPASKLKPHFAKEVDVDEAKHAKREWLDDVAQWLPQRWERAAEEKASGNLREFSKWYFDDATERQKEVLADIKKISDFGAPAHLTKGQASDLIGLFEEPEQEELEILKFFKVPTRGMSQTKARMGIARLFLDDANKHAWEKRPPKSMQKEFYVFFDLPVPKGMTYGQMKADIAAKLADMDDEDTDSYEASDNWDAYENYFEELNDPEFRKDMDLKKVSLKIYREFIKKKQSEGLRLSDLDEFQIAEELLEEMPELSKQ